MYARITTPDLRSHTEYTSSGQCFKIALMRSKREEQEGNSNMDCAPRAATVSMTGGRGYVLHSREACHPPRLEVYNKSENINFAL